MDPVVGSRVLQKMPSTTEVVDVVHLAPGLLSRWWNTQAVKQLCFRRLELLCMLSVLLERSEGLSCQCLAGIPCCSFTTGIVLAAAQVLVHLRLLCSSPARLLRRKNHGLTGHKMWAS